MGVQQVLTGTVEPTSSVASNGAATPQSDETTTAVEGTAGVVAGVGASLPRLAALARQELGSIRARLLLARTLAALFPVGSGNRLRALGLRAAGFEVGRGTLIYGMPVLCGSGDLAKRLVIGRVCLINQGCYFDLQAPITIGDRVGIGPQVMLMTATHEIGTSEARAGSLKGCPISVEDGVWLGARSTVLPGVTIGAGSVVGAGVVVSRSLPPNTLKTTDQQVSLARWRC